MFVKGDKEEILVEVERIVEKPIIQEVLKVVYVDKERTVPVLVQQDKPVIV